MNFIKNKLSQYLKIFNSFSKVYSLIEVATKGNILSLLFSLLIVNLGFALQILSIGAMINQESVRSFLVKYISISTDHYILEGAPIFFLVLTFYWIGESLKFFGKKQSCNLINFYAANILHKIDPEVKSSSNLSKSDHAISFKCAILTRRIADLIPSTFIVIFSLIALIFLLKIETTILLLTLTLVYLILQLALASQTSALQYLTVNRNKKIGKNSFNYSISLKNTSLNVEKLNFITKSNFITGNYIVIALIIFVSIEGFQSFSKPTLLFPFLILGANLRIVLVGFVALSRLNNALNSFSNRVNNKSSSIDSDGIEDIDNEIF